jgi:hypothetical protein
MKNDPFFNLTAVIVLAGVVAAFANPASTPVSQPLTPASSISAAGFTPAAPIALVAPSDANPIASPSIHPRHRHHRAVEKS